MDSFQSLIQRIATMAIGLGFGWVAAKISLFAAYGLIAALCTVYLVVFIAAAGKVELREGGGMGLLKFDFYFAPSGAMRHLRSYLLAAITSAG
jgi:uncharacterized membrane protein YccC